MKNLVLFITTILLMSSTVESLTKLKRVVNTFEGTKFSPPQGVFSFVTSNCHWQTIVGSGALKNKFDPIKRNFDVRNERFNTPDNDFFDVEYTTNFDTAKNIVFVLHGLESSSKGPMVTRMTQAFLSKGFGCVLVSFRSCSGEDNNKPGAYHLGFTDDLKLLLKEIHSRYPRKDIYLSGFSLGGNVVLKYLGELGETAYDYNIKGGVVTCVPFDPVLCQPKLDQGFNRAIYSENFLATLKKKAEEKYLKFPNSFNIDKIRACKTIGDFDDNFIAPIFNFKNKEDYYEQSGSIRYLSKIRVPVIAINAKDDPFIEETSLPTEEVHVGPNAPVRLIYTEKGGHCGFQAGYPPSENGWLAEELARALYHISSHCDIIQKSSINA